MYNNTSLQLHSTPLSTSPVQSALPLAPHRRRHSRSSSLSTALKRSASLTSSSANGPSLANPANRSHLDQAPSSPKRRSRRRSSVALVAADTLAGLKDGVSTLNRWSQSTTSSKASGKDNSRSRLSLAGFGSPKSPSSSTAFAAPQRSPPPRPPSSPRRANRYSPPPPHPTRTIHALPPLDTLPTLLPKTYDPKSATSDYSPHFTPSASTARTPDQEAIVATDYFAAKSSLSSSAPTEAGRHLAGRGRGKSGLASPPILSSDVVLKPSAHKSYFAANPTPPPLPNDSFDRSRRTASRETNRHRPSESTDSMSTSKYDDSVGATPPRSREKRDKDKKTMLSRALAKANTAVLLDNAQNFEGAMEAYEDACRLLEQVMLRSSGDEDKRKLEAIRVTYTNRIEELKNLDPTFTASSGKALPSRPMSGESAESVAVRSMFIDEADEEELAVIETATLARIVEDPGPSLPKPSPRESMFTATMREVDAVVTRAAQDSNLLQLPPQKGLSSIQESRQSTMDTNYMPPPLSPRTDSLPTSDMAQATAGASNSKNTTLQVPLAGHTRDNSEESMSWLDTIDESGGSSCGSSMHSLDAAGGGRKRRHTRLGSRNDVEAEFDAALDAAVEAAYDEGFEPDAEYDAYRSRQADIAASTRRNLEIAQERVRQTEREEAISAAKARAREIRMATELGELPHVRQDAEFDFGPGDADDEERMLEEMTKEYMLEGFDFDLQNMSALPRESDSSGISGSTWESSRSSKRTTGPSGLTNSASASSITQIPEHPLTLPPPPPVQTSSKVNGPSAINVRNRRLSGKNIAELKIDTLGQPAQPAPFSELPRLPGAHFDLSLPPQPKSAEHLPGTCDFPIEDNPATAKVDKLQITPPVLPQPSPSESTLNQSPSHTNLARLQSHDANAVPPSPTSKPPKSGVLKQKKSSLSLKNRNLSISSPDGSDQSVQTPTSSTFSAFTSRKASTAPVIPTPMMSNFPNDALPSGGLNLFESDIHSPFSPGSPNPLAPDAPIPLEPCPESFLLRPFWLMRCFYQTLAHPRGGYLSTKLFVPRDVWSTKGVKLKATEDKIAACDLLSAALLKLAQVDTFDADAVYEEISSLEQVLEQVQANLTKRLGSEVGVSAINTLFKDAVTVGTHNGATNSSGDAGVGAANAKSAPFSATKSYLSSWKRLRSKPSGVTLSTLPDAVAEVDKDALMMNSLPMTSLSNIRFAKRELNQVEFSGPNANYMGSLARLFDAAQVLDQIARQVEDPGLKFSSQTHVGLELSTRHASEFFGFYICRFVLSDLTTLLDKFIKRGSEWVLV